MLGPQNVSGNFKYFDWGQIFLFVCILYLKGAYMCVFFTLFNWGQIFKDVLLLEYYIKFEFSS